MSHNSESNRSAGFTLVEMLAALVGASLLLIAISFAINRLSLDWQQSQQAHLAMKADRAADTLRMLVAQAVPLDAEPDAVAFEGNDNGFSVRILPPLAVARAGILDLHVSRRSTAAGVTLLIEFSPVEEGLPKYSEKRDIFSERILVDGLKDIAFEYIGGSAVAAEKGRLPGFGLPKVIKISLISKNPEQFPTMIWASPKANIDGRCLFDPISLTCRL